MSGPADLSAPPLGATGAALDLHEELSTPARVECVCGPQGLRLRSDHGELVKPRGGSVNRCEYCARLAAIENAEMLLLDALDGDAPAIWCVLTTRTATLDTSRFYGALRKVNLALRRRWPDCQYAALLEFTTGYGARSGGRRRPHWNLLLKGVPAAAVDEAREVVVRIWCGQVDAEAHGQHVDLVTEGPGLMRYIALHFMKESQAPPAGFTGQRFNCSRDYFGTLSRAAARRRAKDSLRGKRELWKLLEARPDLDAAQADELARANHRRAARTRWVLTNDRGARLGKQRVPDSELVDRLRNLKRGDASPRPPAVRRGRGVRTGAEDATP